MERVVGIRLRKSGPIIYASADDGELRPNNYVVVQTDKGREMGWVVSAPKAMVFSQPEESLVNPGHSHLNRTYSRKSVSPGCSPVV